MKWIPTKANPSLPASCAPVEALRGDYTDGGGFQVFLLTFFNHHRPEDGDEINVHLPQFETTWWNYGDSFSKFWIFVFFMLFFFGSIESWTQADLTSLIKWPQIPRASRRNRDCTIDWRA